jgi:hypothetical protein
VKQVRIPNASNEQREMMEGLVNQILEGKRNGIDTYVFESEIDHLVYKLYGLTYDEVLIIDPTPPFTQEEYEQDS